MNFLLWLRDAINKPVTVLLALKPKTLCLLVIFNVPLMGAWLNTLNNQKLYTLFRDGDLSKEEYCKERCWKPKKGLRVIDCTEYGRPTPNEDGTFDDEVILISASSLQVAPEQCWVHNFEWHTVIADE